MSETPARPTPEMEARRACSAGPPPGPVVSAHLLPGLPPRDMIADELACSEAPGGFPRFRDQRGILWRPPDELRPADWIPDWTDPATGGCALVLLGTEAWRVKFSPSLHKQSAGVPWLALVPRTSDGVTSDQSTHATLGEAGAAVNAALQSRAHS